MQRHLLVAAVLTTLSLLVSSQTDYPDFFYKLSLQWPPSVCATSQCRTQIPGTFTVHGLWPQSVEDDKPIPPYNKKKCTDDRPKAPDQILVELQPIQGKLKDLWPSILTQKTNEEFWQHEWEYHGMCSDYPDKPYNYFDAALVLATTYKPLEGTEVKPRQDPYKAIEIREAIKAKLGKYPEISCGKVSNTLQLKEIRLCFERAKPPVVLRDCPTKYSNKCSDGNNQVKFPPATSGVLEFQSM
ncbi:Ribonuclease 2, putative [Theobroma cacao]|uniref:Ribonuclease 2, putative n=1 Tax=Theobroma cacao TaxID=3641 RepID=A0A061FYK3_THECC|nr:Ribonuclease 2, putative [Theobroma cacao]